MTVDAARQLKPGTKLIVVDATEYTDWLKLGDIVTFMGLSQYGVDDNSLRLIIDTNPGRGWRPKRFELYKAYSNAVLSSGGNI